MHCLDPYLRLPNAFAIETFMSTATVGMTMNPLPKCWTISKNVVVVFPPFIPNDGNFGDGIPPVTFAGENKILLNHLKNYVHVETG